MATKISATTAIILNRQRSMAPSQKVKMERIEYIDQPVIACAARQDFVKYGIEVKAGEKFFLVQSDRFRGWYYLVVWSDAGAQYQCSCGNPRCTVHTKPVSEHNRTHVKPAPVVASPSPSIEVSPVAPFEDLSHLSKEEVMARLRAGTQRQKEMARKHRDDYYARVQAVKETQGVAS